MTKLKPTSINRAVCTTIGDAAEEALQTVAESFGLHLVRKSARFSDAEATVRFAFQIQGEEMNGIPVLPETRALIGNATWCDILSDIPDDEVVGFTFTNERNDTYRLCGYNSRATRYPYTAIRVSDGKKYKFTPQSMRRYVIRALAVKSASGG